jgi:hypothetical protein
MPDARADPLAELVARLIPEQRQRLIALLTSGELDGR